jgi:hypothetical protein
VNTRISYVVRNSRLAEEEWMNVKVGDIIRMENEHFIAADLLLVFGYIYFAGKFLAFSSYPLPSPMAFATLKRPNWTGKPT